MELSLEFFATTGHLMTGFGTIVLSILLYRTFRHLRAATRASEIQTEYKFRPWIGPTGQIKELFTDQKKKRFEVILKNFGDLPATNVTAYSLAKPGQISKDEIKSGYKVDLGPILPNMEKHFWLDVDLEILQKAKEVGSFYTGMIFEYPLAFGKSEYGMISETNIEKLAFVHKDMWVYSPPLRQT
jgi:hypothetical protein